MDSYFNLLPLKVKHLFEDYLMEDHSRETLKRLIEEVYLLGVIHNDIKE